MHEVDIAVSFYRQRVRAPLALVADDDPDVVAILKEALGRLGYTVIGARDGVDAMQQLARAGSRRLDVLVTDIVMPRGSGLDLIRCVTAEHAPRAVITVSAFGDRSVRAEARALGAHAVFDKPFHLDDLLRIVQRLAPARARRVAH